MQSNWHGMCIPEADHGNLEPIAISMSIGELVRQGAPSVSPCPIDIFAV